jgi:hypothetical protein
MAARIKKPSGITTKTITAAAVFIYHSLQEVPLIFESGLAKSN